MNYEERITSLKWLVPMWPLFRGSTVYIFSLLTKTYLASSLSMTSLLRAPSLERVSELVMGSRLTVWKNPFLSISVARAAAAVRSLANDHEINHSIISLPVMEIIS